MLIYAYLYLSMLIDKIMYQSMPYACLHCSSNLETSHSHLPFPISHFLLPPYDVHDRLNRTTFFLFYCCSIFFPPLCLPYINE